MSSVAQDIAAASAANLKAKELSQALHEAKGKEKTATQAAIATYNNIIFKENDFKTEDIFKLKEEAIYRLGEIYSLNKAPKELMKLNQDLRPFFTDLPKAKTAKIVRTIIELVGKIEETQDIQIEICKESIAWAESEKRTFLRQRIETRLSELYFEKQQYQQALTLITKLLKEVRKLDDKALLVEIQLLESHVHHALRNIPKSRAALTAARTAANGIYCPPLLQAEIDMQSGILHAEEKDYKTAYSYFFEAFEGFNSLDHPSAAMCLKYMMLCKVMINQPEDVQSLLSTKNALKYSGDQVESMRAVSTAYQERSLHAFENSLKQYKRQLTDDPIISSHLTELYDNLLEQHLLRIIEPFARVEISHTAKLINLPRERVERKLSQMILDKKLHGTLDQGRDCIIVFDERKQDKLYPEALSVIDNMNTVVDALFERAKQIK